MFSIVDVETTGGIGGQTRLTEVAIFRYDGVEVVDSFHSLLNPHCPIPPFIARMTGISDEMVQEAPDFADVAHHIARVTEGAVFVAHNAPFDYGFLKKEFAWIGLPFERHRLCTVQLSRRIFPGLPSYSLGKLCRSLEIPVKNRHRADGDAAATVKLFELLLMNDMHGLIKTWRVSV
ncbi:MULTISPECIES: 3'-5' exonuclease [Larkinella]|uniref:3'-5' exonuclease n=1 Tax=Larkinella punicea TaxID=2315727 RepID=A0A368JXJ0_9BACT|nr:MULTISPECIES: 3'-5' exonuclease [Larkinella]RCR71394.1 3'-5' exonuclease [Larkinella punicea]